MVTSGQHVRQDAGAPARNGSGQGTAAPPPHVFPCLSWLTRVIPVYGLLGSCEQEEGEVTEVLGGGCA